MYSISEYISTNTGRLTPRYIFPHIKMLQDSPCFTPSQKGWNFAALYSVKPSPMNFLATYSPIWTYLTLLYTVGLPKAQSSTSPTIYTITTVNAFTLPPMPTSPGAQIWGTEISESDGTTEIVLACDSSLETAPSEPCGDFVGATLTTTYRWARLEV